VPKRKTLVSIGLILAPLVGCSSGSVAPRFDLVSARTLDRTDDGQVIVLTLRGENANAHEIELRNARYKVMANGVEIFRGKRSAEVALPRYGRVDLELLAAFPLDQAPPDLSTISVTGTVEYLPPGPFAETLYDNRLRRPTVSLKGSAELED
jgi:Late embryogenesis abundant protein